MPTAWLPGKGRPCSLLKQSGPISFVRSLRVRFEMIRSVPEISRDVISLNADLMIHRMRSQEAVSSAVRSHGSCCSGRCVRTDQLIDWSKCGIPREEKAPSLFLPLVLLSCSLAWISISIRWKKSSRRGRRRHGYGSCCRTSST